MTDREKLDLTRHNRPGQPRLRYLNGNGATFLETLRAELHARFGSQLGGELSAYATPTNGIEQQYIEPRAPTPDWAWEIARALARATHVLGEHLDAYANEGFLGTALLPESVRRLAALIDYVPAPPASAVTLIALEAKENQRGTVAAGLTLSGSPPGSGAQVVFETLSDVYVDSDLNALRHDGYDRNEDLVAGTKQKLAKRIDGLSPGEPVLLKSGDQVEAFLLVSSAVVGSQTELTLDRVPSQDFTIGSTEVLLKPKERLRPIGTTTNILRLRQPVEVEANAWVALLVSNAAGMPQHVYYQQVEAYTKEKLELSLKLALPLSSSQPVSLCTLNEWTPTSITPSETEPHTLDLCFEVEKMPQLLVGESVGVQFIDGIIHFRVIGAQSKPVPKAKLLTSESIQGKKLPEKKIIFVFAWESSSVMLDMRLDVTTKDLFLELPNRPLSDHEWLTLSDGQHVAWAQVGKSQDGEALLFPAAAGQHSSSATFWQSGTTAFGGFSECVQLAEAKHNRRSVPVKSEVELDKAPASLKPDMRVIVELLDLPGCEDENVIQKIDWPTSAKKKATLHLKKPLPEEATKSNLRICANVVLAGHGERRPEKILGSGDATKGRQRFLLTDANPGVAFIADPRMPTGVRAAVLIKVDGIIYREVPRLEDCAPGDCVFVTRKTDEGFLLFEFGDGQSGRRLPTGRDNVRISYRQGCGLLGNVAKQTLKLAHPHALLKDARQPFNATGGSDGQDLDSLRSHAPASLQALERAVSLQDFAALAQSHSKVWQAAAVRGAPSDDTTATPPRGVQAVTVFVVPAGGVGLPDSLQRELEEFLNDHTTPRARACVRCYSELALRLRIKVEVTQRTHDPAQVVNSIREVLLRAFSLRQRRLGQTFYLSEAYKLVEAISGVAASDCTFADAEHAAAQFWPVTARQVLCLSPANPNDLIVSATEYVP